jgi:hydroxymethylglutaryl-CoA synthase
VEGTDLRFFLKPSQKMTLTMDHSMTTNQFGIGGLSVFVPPYRVKLDAWCGWTGNAWDKISAVVGHSFRMPGPEDSVYTMAAEAVLQLILEYGIDPDSVGYLSLATESSIDNAVGGVIVRGLVDQGLKARGLRVLSRNCEVPEVKQACLGGVYALKGAIRYLAYDGADRQAIVVAADFAEYARGSTGEPTQGAGAVAMLVERNPRMLALDLRNSGSSSNYRIADFRKPFTRFCGQTAGPNGRLRDFPLFNGKYSTACYIDEVVCAFDALFGRRGGPRAEFLRSLSATFMHRPYHNMPVNAWATAYLFALGADGGAELAELAAYCETAQIDLQQLLAEMRTRPTLGELVADGTIPEEAYPLTGHLIKAFRRSGQYKEVVDAKLRLGSAAMMHMGNLYNAALPAWLGAGFEEAHDKAADIGGSTMLLVGYGSGDAAEAIVATVAPTWRTAAAKIGLARALEGAVDVTQQQYIALHEGLNPDSLPPPRKSGFTVARMGTRNDPKFSDLGLEYYQYRV